MSRIGKKAIKLPKGIEVNVTSNKVIIKNSKISKELDITGKVNAKFENEELVFTNIDDSKQAKALWGTYRALANNMIIGLDVGFEKKLEINGVGYKAVVKGEVLELNLGFSHPINYKFPKSIVISVEKNVVSIKGDDKQKVGQIASEIRSFRPPEPYKGKGVKYVGEHIIRKAGKTAK
jgi:large subunit ribosomal protein L6